MSVALYFFILIFDKSVVGRRQNARLFSTHFTGNGLLELELCTDLVSTDDLNLLITSSAKVVSRVEFIERRWLNFLRG